MSVDGGLLIRTGSEVIDSCFVRVDEDIVTRCFVVWNGKM